MEGSLSIVGIIFLAVNKSIKSNIIITIQSWLKCKSKLIHKSPIQCLTMTMKPIYNFFSARYHCYLRPMEKRRQEKVTKKKALKDLFNQRLKCDCRNGIHWLGMMKERESARLVNRTKGPGYEPLAAIPPLGNGAHLQQVADGGCYERLTMNQHSITSMWWDLHSGAAPPSFVAVVFIIDC